VRLEVASAEMTELPLLLQKGETDFIVLDHELHKAGLEKKILVGNEYVLIESKTLKGRKGFFLDHDSEDTANHAVLRGGTGQTGTGSRALLPRRCLWGPRRGFPRAGKSRHVSPPPHLENPGTGRIRLSPPKGTRSLHYYVQLSIRLQKNGDHVQISPVEFPLSLGK